MVYRAGTRARNNDQRNHNKGYTMTKTQPADDYDSPWKDALEVYITECLAFFFPRAAEDIDWSRGYHFLDKELQQVAPEAPTGRRTVDKLIRSNSAPK
jgi:hypothetical protein